ARDGATQPRPSKNETGTWVKIADFEVFVAPGKDINKVIEKYMKYLRRKRSGMKLTKFLPSRIKSEKVYYQNYKIHGKGNA
ncbi:MAG: hypothetical protein ACRDE7_00150, partial [Sphingobacterium sp.]